MEENLKISEMTPVETVTGTEIIPCVTGEPKKNKSVTIYQIYAAYNAVQSVSLSDQEYDDVLSDFVPHLPLEEEEETVTNLKI
jgi:hypothetical protein